MVSIQASEYIFKIMGSGFYVPVPPSLLLDQQLISNADTSAVSVLLQSTVLWSLLFYSIHFSMLYSGDSQVAQHVGLHLWGQRWGGWRWGRPSRRHTGVATQNALEADVCLGAVVHAVGDGQHTGCAPRHARSPPVPSTHHLQQQRIMGVPIRVVRSSLLLELQTHTQTDGWERKRPNNH